MSVPFTYLVTTKMIDMKISFCLADMAIETYWLQPKLKDKVAIVTGGCLGIGRGCVGAFGDLRHIEYLKLSDD